MDIQKKIFFDNRDKYLSFVHTTDEKIKTAFYLSAQLDGVAPDRPYLVFDAGTGEGTVIATFLTALHQKMPNVPIVVTGKEISIDDLSQDGAPTVAGRCGRGIFFVRRASCSGCHPPPPLVACTSKNPR